MKSIDLLKSILMSTEPYWIVSRETSFREFGESKRGKDSIILIVIPDSIPRGLKYEEITLKHLEELAETRIESNIFLNENYPPFQRGIIFNDLYRGFSMLGGFSGSLKELLEFSSDDIWDYEKFIREKALHKTNNE